MLLSLKRFVSDSIKALQKATRMSVFSEQLVALGARKDLAEHFAPWLYATMEQYEINTPLRKAHFLAQLFHESGRLRYNEEIASGAAYEGRKDLGNVKPGDGKRFKGRGLIQLTGRDNYEKYAEYRHLDSAEEAAKRLSESPEYQTDVAGWYWEIKNLNLLADQDDIKAITRKINGGQNGLADRQALLEKAKEIFV